MPLLDLHVSDLLNTQLRSHFDYTSVYDMLVIRRLDDGDTPASSVEAVAPVGRKAESKNAALPATRQAQTVPVGFVVFDRVLLRSEEHTSELQSLMRYSYAVF